MTYAVPLEELLAAARVPAGEIRESQPPVSTNGLPQELQDDIIRIASIAGV